MTASQQLPIFAPAKINLFLHITGRREDGYHLLDSLVGFADIGDEIMIEPADNFSFELRGPFADRFADAEQDFGPDSKNLAVRAAYLSAEHYRQDLNVRITLSKNLPLAAGIGGGSADAAAVINGLQRWWGLSQDDAFADALMVDLGADLPVCYAARPIYVQGVGEILTPVSLPDLPVLLVNPLVPCSTRDVFKARKGSYSPPTPALPGFADAAALIEFLQTVRNDLQPAAQAIVPEIHGVLEELEDLKECQLARLSGSGATCFAIFESAKAVQAAKAALAKAQPGWWIEGGVLKGAGFREG